MKKIFFSIMAAAAVFAGCNQHVIETVQEGQFSLNMSATGEYVTVDMKSAPATKAEATPDVNEFVIDIERNSGDVSKHFDRFGDMPQVLNLPSGVYTITASSAENLPAAFDQPVYGASKSFSVNVGKVTTETLVCTLQNVKVLFKLSEAFENELSSYTISVSNGDAVENTLYWTNVASVTADSYTTKDISTAGYFSVAPLKIRVDGKRATDGSEAYHEITILNVAAQTQIEITLDAKVTGNAGFQITVDPSVNVRPEDIFVPGFDETPVPDLPEGGEDTGDDSGDDNGDDNGSGDDSGDDNTEEPAMTLVWVGNDSFATQEIVSGMSVDLQLSVPEGIKEFLISVASDTPMFMFLVSNMTSNPADYATMDQLESVDIDLINDPVAVDAMAADGIELPTGENLLGQTYVDFPLSNLVPMIPEMGGAGPDTYHTFTLKVVDSKDNECEWSLTFHVPAE